MTVLTLVHGEGTWRSRKVQYYAGDWPLIQTVMPEFELRPFVANQDDPSNPYLQTVMRKPLSPAERLIPVGTVSHTYSLVPHREIATLCRESIVNIGFEPSELRYEVGLSELGEWMNFRIYFPDSYSFRDLSGDKLDLRLECFNSVEGSTRLLILFSWYRIICSNGLAIKETTIDINDRHQRLDLTSIATRIETALKAVEADRIRMEKWQAEKITIQDVATWADGALSAKWRKKAAARVFHICESGKDVEFDDPFSPGVATQKPIRYLDPVPGSPDRAATKYDVSQAMSFVATHRNNLEERADWQAQIPDLLERLNVA